jgi:Uma2 family endonuclease
MSVGIPALVTADELSRMPNSRACELLEGVITRMSPAGWKHGNVSARLVGMLIQHVTENDLGEVFSTETGFTIARDPDTVRAPDAAFIRKDHLPATPPEDAFWPGPPDLAVEVISPGDTTGEIDDKVKAWLDAGSAMVWVVNPKWRSVTVYRSATDIKTLTENDELVGQDVLPGFHCRLREIFV